MYIILIFLLIILVLYFIYKFFYSNKVDDFVSKNKLISSDDCVIRPSDYYVLQSRTFENKFEHSEKMLRSIGAKNQLINKLKNIRNKTGKNIVYGIKNKDGKYRIEIYLYSKDCTELNHSNADKDKFKKDLNIILNEFGQKMNDNIDNLFNNYNIILISFDLELTDSSFNNKLHLYLTTKEITQYTYTYDIDKNEIELESNFNRVKNYDKLEEVLSNYKLNKNEFINELKEISPNPDSIMFHYKYYNNSIGIYLMENTIDRLKFFIEKYNFKNLILDESCTNLLFDLVVNYDLNQGKINGVGFSDYF
jgi:hypothetical protein